MQKTLGGERLGSGKKMKVHLHGYERSTHDLGYLWRSTMAPGTLVPFMCEVALPGDTFDIHLDCKGLTHPTIGPLFGTYKIQLDVFQAPIRLYQAMLHNNALGIGMNMAQVKLPKITLPAVTLPTDEDADIDNCQINPSCLLSYLGIRGVGDPLATGNQTRVFNAVPILAYWEIYKQYYSNKMEEIGAVIHTPAVALGTEPDSIKIFTAGTETTLPEYPTTGSVSMVLGSQIRLYYTGTAPIPNNVMMNTFGLGLKSADEYSVGVWTDAGTYLWSPYRQTMWGNQTAQYWRMRADDDINTGAPSVATFDLANIDTMRNEILAAGSAEFNINTPDLEPYIWLSEAGTGTTYNMLSSQEGLGLKTYQSDLFNNWLQTEWIDGVNGITEITAIDTSGGQFTLDTLNLSKKVYDMLNRIAVSGGTYDDWLDAVYTHDRYQRCESPMYMGGLSKEMVFQEVISNSQSDEQPLGTIAGRGVMADKHKGGYVVAKIDEPSYLIGIVSITPRLDYSQGNKWDVHLDTLDDLHKPALDEIGFQELITEQMAWWDTKYISGNWETRSAGKQPAWLNYMTNVNQVRGNFAVRDNEMFMVLNRRYEMDSVSKNIADLTTYIDPSKFNHIFAETALDAQNFWMQISVDITARRKMSAKVMPNL